MRLSELDRVADAIDRTTAPMLPLTDLFHRCAIRVAPITSGVGRATTSVDHRTGRSSAGAVPSYRPASVADAGSRQIGDATVELTRPTARND